MAEEQDITMLCKIQMADPKLEAVQTELHYFGFQHQARTQRHGQHEPNVHFYFSF